MNLRGTILTVLITLSAAASAAPAFTLNDGVWRPHSTPGVERPMLNDGVWRGDCGCRGDGQVGNLRDLLIPVNIIGTRPDGSLDDGRDNITKNQKDLGLSDSEVRRIRASTGYVVCPGEDNQNFGTASAVLVESNQQIVTAAHAFYDEQGRPRSPLSHCFFQNQEVPYKRVPLDFDSGTERFGKRGLIGWLEREDYAVVRLKEPISTADAVPFSLSSKAMKSGQKFIAISAYQDVPGRTIDPEVPVAQKSVVKQVNAFHGEVPTEYFTEADLQPTGSGGAVFTKENGQLVLSGIVVASGKPELNGLNYDVAKGSLTRVIGVDAKFRSAVLEPKKGSR
jgi:hypothetical protein